MSKEQQQFLEKAKEGHSIFLTGKAGTGKTFVLSQFTEWLKEQKKNYVIVAPTGIAAFNAGGVTIHHLFGLFVFRDGEINNKINTYPFRRDSYFDSTNNDQRRNILKNADVVIIDEVSMLRPDVLDAMNWKLENSSLGGLNKKQVIFCGDLKQLPVIVSSKKEQDCLKESYKGFYFNNSFIYNEIKPIEISLDTVYRQSDMDFIDNLNLLRENKHTDYFKRFVSDEIPIPNSIILAPKNSTVNDYNIKGLLSLEGSSIEFKSSYFGDAKPSDFMVMNNISVKDGAKIMYLTNEKGLFNGSLGTLVVKNNDYFFKKSSGDLILLEKYKFRNYDYEFNESRETIEMVETGGIDQYPIKLAYAMSIHKCQGLTLEFVTADLRGHWQHEQMYVAISRVTSPDGLKIII
jgi:ATP-dependent DNA helicase PIF1